MELTKHTETIQGLVTKPDFDDRMDAFAKGRDTSMAVLNRLEQERLFTFEAVKRVEGEVGRLRKDVDRQDAEIGRIEEMVLLR